jgi:hypothetical protein
MRLGLRQLGLTDERLALDDGLRIALSDQEVALGQWLTGTPILKPAALPETSDETALLSRMQMRARGEMRSETARLMRILTTLRDRPGAWALYPETGQIPLT